ncbi:hypothetical protein [Halovivax sp.]|nr:hypothetical protein [Halovivax sp.]
MTPQTTRLCISCGDRYDRANKYHGYYCGDCRLETDDRQRARFAGRPA